MGSCRVSALSLLGFAVAFASLALARPAIGAASASGDGILLVSSTALGLDRHFRSSSRKVPVAEPKRRVPELLILAQADGLTSFDVPASDALRFEIRSYRIEGNTLLQPAQIERVLAPFVGKQKDFGDVQRALEVLQGLYQESGYAGIQITLPEQELERGDVMFKVVEPRIGRVLVEGNEHFSTENARRSAPGLVVGRTPLTRTP